MEFSRASSTRRACGMLLAGLGGILAVFAFARPSPAGSEEYTRSASQVVSGRIPALSSSARTWAFRLKPGQDLKSELYAFVKAQDLKAVCILTCVGSLTDTAIRYANQKETVRMRGHFEIVSLVGTLEPGGGHLHISVSDGKGRTIGGHLAEGNRVYTTAEIVLAELPEVRFVREKDETFGYDELAVHPREP